MFSFIQAGIMYLPFRDALCFEFKIEWLLEMNYMPVFSKDVEKLWGFFLCALKERRHNIKCITFFS